MCYITQACWWTHPAALPSLMVGLAGSLFYLLVMYLFFRLCVRTEKRNMRRTYTIEQIKVAFHAEFYGAGELWFPYPEMGAPIADCENAVEEYFMTFKERLEKP